VSTITSELVYALIAILTGCSIFAAYLWFVSKSTLGLTFLKKGYGAVFRLVTIISCYLAIFLVGIYVAYITLTLIAPIPVWLWGFGVLPFAFLPYVLLWGIVTALPKRNNRRAGRREFPFIFSKSAKRLERGLVVSGYLAPLMLVAPAYFLKQELDFWEVLKGLSKIAGVVLLLTVSIPRLFSYLRERASSPTIEEASAVDPRAPVMYLRAFQNEQAPFTSGTEDEMARYKTSILPFGHRVFVTFELYFSKAFSEALGPLVALGNPQDDLTPAGAIRDYAADNEWQTRFRELAQISIAFVMQPSNTASVQWEIGALSSMQLRHRLFVITPPESTQKRPIARLFDPPSNAELSPDWSEFCAAMINLGFFINLQDPGPGAVISFQRNGYASLLAYGANTPEQYLSAIKRHLSLVS
jgi:hypothetical protein